MAKFTGTNHGITVTVELPHEDITVDECFDAFRAIMCGLSFLNSQIDDHILEEADHINKRDSS